jgi:SAM-dependent methyltransferase
MKVRNDPASEGSKPFRIGRNFEEQVKAIACRFPRMRECIQLDNFSNEQIENHIRDLGARSRDFNSRSKGGRGDLYRQAQRDPLVRKKGIKKLFDLVSPDFDAKSLRSEHKILDVLGGDGTLARAFAQLFPGIDLLILTSDISAEMIASALAYNLPAILQPANALCLKDSIFDGVIIAYGTHHIPRTELNQVLLEGNRVLKPRGRIVVHDFEESSAVDLWFSEVVDRYSETGHRFQHFTAEEMHELLAAANFVDIKVQYVYDPFIIYGRTESEASRKLAAYLLRMYGLTRLLRRYGRQGAYGQIKRLAGDYFVYDYPSMGLDRSFGLQAVAAFKEGAYWRVEMPRVAMVGTGTKT